jgi:anti-sigma regulatory factor (Ser/Thr protein kinase)
MTRSSFSVRLPYDASASASARRLVAELLARFGSSDEVIGDAKLVVHELVVNGLTHGAPDEDDRIAVQARVTDGELVISVLDHGTSGDVLARPLTADLEHGRGLAMVATLCRCWTVERSGGTCVSARLPLSGQAPS